MHFFLLVVYMPGSISRLSVAEGFLFKDLLLIRIIIQSQSSDNSNKSTSEIRNSNTFPGSMTAIIGALLGVVEQVLPK